MDRSESIKELAAALAKAQAALKPAVKDSVNPHYKSKFASLGAVWEACKEALAANGLSVCQFPVSGEQGRVGVTTVLMHASGEFIAETLTVPLAKQDAQGVGSALSYSRRYALAACLGICSEDDDDGHAASQPPKKRPQRPARPHYHGRSQGAQDVPVRVRREVGARPRHYGVEVRLTDFTPASTRTAGQKQWPTVQATVTRRSSRPRLRSGTRTRAVSVSAAGAVGGESASRAARGPSPR
jgi:hypothetical protein